MLCAGRGIDGLGARGRGNREKKITAFVTIPGARMQQFHIVLFSSKPIMFSGAAIATTSRQ